MIRASSAPAPRARRIAALLFVLPLLIFGSRPLSAAADTIEFGTDARGKPITWNRTQSNEEGVKLAVDDKGKLHIKFVKGGTLELRATDEDFFGAYDKKTPWVEWSWMDANVHGKMPNIDLMLEDGRPEKMSNRIAAGSLFNWGRIAQSRVSRPPDGAVQESAFLAEGVRRDGEQHKMRIGKDADGVSWCVADSRAFESTGLKDLLGDDHSAWGSLVLRIRLGQEGEEFIFNSFTMGDDFQTPPNKVVVTPPPGPVGPTQRPKHRDDTTLTLAAFAGTCVLAIVAVVWLVWRRR